MKKNSKNKKTGENTEKNIKSAINKDITDETDLINRELSRSKINEFGRPER